VVESTEEHPRDNTWATCRWPTDKAVASERQEILPRCPPNGWTVRFSDQANYN